MLLLLSSTTKTHIPYSHASRSIEPIAQNPGFINIVVLLTSLMKVRYQPTKMALQRNSTVQSRRPYTGHRRQYDVAVMHVAAVYN